MFQARRFFCFLFLFLNNTVAVVQIQSSDARFVGVVYNDTIVPDTNTTLGLVIFDPRVENLGAVRSEVLFCFVVVVVVLVFFLFFSFFFLPFLFFFHAINKTVCSVWEKMVQGCALCASECCETAVTIWHLKARSRQSQSKGVSMGQTASDRFEEAQLFISSLFFQFFFLFRSRFGECNAFRHDQHRLQVRD